MKAETVEALVGRIHAVEAEVDVLHSAVAAETLPASQQQYLARCFDLLRMELAAVRTYIADVTERCD
ncbi:MAG TPA: hypothetical protein VEO54_31635 [Thermoanaerobaculia bacterium]|nr:hypothetical protein [Thermoanaerobaculia bacterium]